MIDLDPQLVALPPRAAARHRLAGRHGPLRRLRRHGRGAVVLGGPARRARRRHRHLRDQRAHRDPLLRQADRGGAASTPLPRGGGGHRGGDRGPAPATVPPPVAVAPTPRLLTHAPREELVAYLGPAGTFTETAARLIVGADDATCVPAATSPRCCGGRGGRGRPRRRADREHPRGFGHRDARRARLRHRPADHGELELPVTWSPRPAGTELDDVTRGALAPGRARGLPPVAVDHPAGRGAGAGGSTARAARWSPSRRAGARDRQPAGRRALRPRGPRPRHRRPGANSTRFVVVGHLSSRADRLGQDLAGGVHRGEPPGCAAAAARDLRRARPQPDQDRVPAHQGRARRVLLLPRRRGPPRRRAGRRRARRGQAHPPRRQGARLLPALRARAHRRGRARSEADDADAGTVEAGTLQVVGGSHQHLALPGPFAASQSR
jgi:hypothetical protein